VRFAEGGSAIRLGIPLIGPSLQILVGAIAFALAILSGGMAIAADSSQALSSSAAPSPAQSAKWQVPASGGTSATYVGSQACQGCHQASTQAFGDTMMGNILIKHPRDSAEQHGCESCHGPGSAYVPEMAAALGKGATPEQAMHGPPADSTLITFRPDSGESQARENGACLTCHQ
jgi:hypothetical protein